MSKDADMTKFRFVCVLIAGLAAFTCITQAKAQPKTVSIKIGVILPLTGVAALPAKHAKNAVQLAAEELSASRDLKLQVVFEDSKSEPKAAVSSYTKLVVQDRVDAVVGDLWDFLVVPLVSLSKRHAMPTISPTVMGLENGELHSSPFFWSLGSQMSSLDNAVSRFFELHRGKTRTAIFCWENNWGEVHRRRWRTLIERSSLSLVAEKCEADFASDLRALTLAITQKKPEMIIASTILGTFAKRLAEAKNTAVVLTTSDLLEEIQNKELDQSFIDGWYFTQWQDPPGFSEKYMKKFGYQPRHEASNSYYAILALVDAARSKKVGDSLTESLRQVRIEKEDGRAISFAQHPFANTTKAELYRYTKGEIVRVD